MPPQGEYFASGYTRDDLKTMHPNIELEPEWVKCPQCGRENSPETWNKFGGKCPNCRDLYNKESQGDTPSVSQPTEFQSKVVKKLAIKWDGTNEDAVLAFCVGNETRKASFGVGAKRDLIIETLEGTMRADKDDWIIRGLKGEFYPCKPDIFANSYEPVGLSGTLPSQPEPKSMHKETPFTLRLEGGFWVAHAVAFDLVATDSDKLAAINQLKTCLGAQIAFGLKQGLPATRCFFPAPVKYWKPPYSFMPMPTDEELAAFKFEVLPTKEGPAPLNEDAQRKKFEAWALTKYYEGLEDEAVAPARVAWGYADDDVENAWQGWLAGVSSDPITSFAVGTGGCEGSKGAASGMASGHDPDTKAAPETQANTSSDPIKEK